MFLATHEKEFKSPVPIGTVTLMSIAGNMPRESLDLAEVEIPSSTNKPTSNFGDNQHADQTRLESSLVRIKCLYCESRFDNKKDLSKHIDRIHLGSGSLEGDIRRW